MSTSSPPAEPTRPRASDPDRPGAGTSAFDLVVLDLAGTTVQDDGVVERAFASARERSGIADRMPWDQALDHVRATMGQSKIDVFTHLAGGDARAAVAATAAFEEAFARLVTEEGVAEVPGAGELLRDLRSAGVRVVLTTGFAPATREAVLTGLGWSGLVDAALSPVDVGRGRPAPDLVLAAALRVRVGSMAAVAVVGDTASDVACGLRAGAGLVVGVLSGAHDADVLTAAGAHLVLPDVTALRPHLGLPS